MEKERNLGVTEARFALTLLTCLLVAIGYVALLRLGGGTKDSPPEAGVDEISPPILAGPVAPEVEPRVLPLEKPGDRRSEPTSGIAKRPKPTPELPETERR